MAAKQSIYEADQLDDEALALIMRPELKVEYKKDSDTSFREAQTADVSCEGLFLVTDEDLPSGARVKLKIEIGPCVLPLTARRESEPTLAVPIHMPGRTNAGPPRNALGSHAVVWRITFPENVQ